MAVSEKELYFRSDTKHRKDWFTGISFQHPAKMVLPLQLWIIENYTKPGDVILDPMAGSGTVLVACSMGRHVIAVELEAKFCEIMRGNWEKIKQRGPQMGCEMGECIILQGDARNLEGLLADVVITSPPYALTVQKGHEGVQAWKVIEGLKNADNATLRARSKELTTQEKILNRYGKSDGQIGNLPYGSIDSIITSPPYENAQQTKDDDYVSHHITGGKLATHHVSENNIGNLKSTDYLSAMLAVYKSCHAVLRPQGLMILVVKNFLRNQTEVRLDSDTIALCENTGFQLVERHYRVLPSQSFWRVIYAKKFPQAPVLDREHVLIFKRITAG